MSVLEPSLQFLDQQLMSVTAGIGDQHCTVITQYRFMNPVIVTSLINIHIIFIAMCNNNISIHLVLIPYLT